jgi:hypothetical protein
VLTTCTATRFGEHDYSQPPHNTPDEPVTGCDCGDPSGCHSLTAKDCERDGRYELVLYQIGTHEWITLRACVPCTAVLRVRHATLGPRMTEGIYSVRSLRVGDDG